MFIVHFVVTVLIASLALALALAEESLLFRPDLIQTHAGQGIEI